MKKMSPAVIILAFTAACGGAKPSVTGPDSLSRPLPACRNYASAFDTTIFSSYIANSTASTTCAFDRATLSLRCNETAVGPLAGTTAETSTYASLADFVEEAAAVGRTRVQRIEFAGSRSAIQMYSYDAQKRPTRLEIQMNGDPFVTTIYTAWDALGRPVTSTDESGTSPWTTTYDDDARTVTSTGTDSTLTTSYDAAGNLLRLVFAIGGTTNYSTTSTITATAAVCL